MRRLRLPTDGLPVITGHVTLVGETGTVIRRSPAALTSATIENATMAENTTTGVGGGAIINSGLLTLDESSLTGNHAPINGGALDTQAAGVSHISQSQFAHNVSGGLGGAIANLGTTTLYGTSVRFNTGSGGGGIATGNSNVTLKNSTVTSNTPDNCSPLNTIAGCVN